MVGLRFLIAILVCFLAGLPWMRVFGGGPLNRGPGLGLAGLVGAVVVTLEMLALSITRVPWSLFGIVIPILLIGAVAFFLTPQETTTSPRVDWRKSLPAICATLLALLTLTFIAGTARATSVDLLLFWGSKAARFALKGGIDLPFLRDPANEFIHPDYPPLVPFLYAFGAMAAGRFAWGASLLYTPIFLAFGLLVFWGCARSTGERRAAELTAVLGLLTAYELSVSLSIGNAEPFLLSFEMAALAVLCFMPASKRRDVVVSVLLAGAVLTKVEGLFFAALVVPVYGIGKGWRGRLVRLAALPGLSAAAWIAYCWANGVLYVYRGGKIGSLTLANLPVTIAEFWKSASYGAFYIPWLVLLTLLITGEVRTMAIRPIVVGSGFLAIIIFMFLHSNTSPALWIGWGGTRLLLTPFVCAFFSVATYRRSSSSPLGS